ncbi:MAG: glycosyltransferase family 2 protein [Cyanobacteriota bacterium]
MSESNELNLVIPVYNEQEAIGNVLEKWSEELDRLSINYKIHVYNDGSKDKTLDILNKISCKLKNVIVHDKLNSGHGPTILLGYRENSNSRWLFQIDSDDEFGPDDFEKLWKERENYDFLLGRKKESDAPLPRKIVSLISRLTVWILYGRGVYYVNSPYRLMRCEKFKDYYSKIPEDTFAPNVILTGIASNKKFRIYEIPVSYKLRTTGEVSIKKWKLFKVAARSFMQTIMFRFKI